MWWIWNGNIYGFHHRFLGIRSASVSADTCVCSGDNRVGLVGQHLLSLVDGVNPCWFDKVQVGVLHQCLWWRTSRTLNHSILTSANKILRGLKHLWPTMQMFQHWHVFIRKAFLQLTSLLLISMSAYHYKDGEEVTVKALCGFQKRGFQLCIKQ